MPDALHPAPEALASANRLELVLEGSSMHPWLKRGARLVVDLSRIDPAPGEVVCLRKQDHWLVHRVLLRCRVFGRTYYVQSAETHFRPGWFTQDTVLGVVIAQRFPDREEAPFLPVDHRPIAVWERFAAFGYLLAVLMGRSGLR